MIEQAKCIKQYTFNALNIIKELSHVKGLYFHEILHMYGLYGC